VLDFVKVGWAKTGKIGICCRTRVTLKASIHEGFRGFAGTTTWFRLAAEQGNASGQHSLSLMYARGEGVPKDYREAAKWNRLAVEQGNAFAQDRLGVMYAYGIGVPQDHREAVKWYRLAAEQGNASGQFSLGAAYAQGLGVHQDDRESVKWIRLAAEQGHAVAQGLLGASYADGAGVIPNKVVAYALFNLSEFNLPSNVANAANGLDPVTQYRRYV
jgi:TPR repeat protein